MEAQDGSASRPGALPPLPCANPRAPCPDPSPSLVDHQPTEAARRNKSRGRRGSGSTSSASSATTCAIRSRHRAPRAAFAPVRRAARTAGAGVARIAASADRMARMIDRPPRLRPHRGSAGEFPIHRRRIDLRQICEQTVEELEFAYTPPGECSRSKRRSHGETGNPDRMAQVISNLVGNACASAKARWR